MALSMTDRNMTTSAEGSSGCRADSMAEYRADSMAECKAESTAEWGTENSTGRDRIHRV